MSVKNALTQKMKYQNDFKWIKETEEINATKIYPNYLGLYKNPNKKTKFEY